MVAAILRWLRAQRTGRLRPRHPRAADTGATLTIPVGAPVLATESFIGTVVELLAGARLAPELVGLEIPVQVLERDAGALTSRFATLAAEGVRLDLSGVGVGNLPLAALTEIAWSGWKLDGYLVRTARARPEAGALAAGLIALAREMKAVSIAEQVDEALDLTWLGLHRCDLAQGAALRRPVEADQLSALVAELRKNV
jgi:EAL domain-containing protein (putative c-di-GMP-specific phosphodiesterase class I)